MDEAIAPLEGDSGATVVAAVLRDRVLHVANAGDARAVLSRSGKAQRLSYDHKASDPAEIARCEALGAGFLWGRLQGQVMVTRALGDQEIKKYCGKHGKGVWQHFFFLIFCFSFLQLAHLIILVLNWTTSLRF